MTARLRIRSPVGTLCVEAGDRGVLGITFEDRGPARAGISARARAHLEGAAEALAAYFAGAPPRLPVLDLRGTSFQLAVWSALREVPWGEVRTYGEVAGLLGRAGGGRAVGGANHENPIAILVPCHRVVQANGRLGGYAAGLEVKRWLLAHEAGHSPALQVGRAAERPPRGGAPRGNARAHDMLGSLPAPAPVRSIVPIPGIPGEHRWRRSSR